MKYLSYMAHNSNLAGNNWKNGIPSASPMFRVGIGKVSSNLEHNDVLLLAW
jgi:hypothetical protein